MLTLSQRFYAIVRFDKICRSFASIARAGDARDVHARCGRLHDSTMRACLCPHRFHGQRADGI